MDRVDISYIGNVRVTTRSERNAEEDTEVVTSITMETMPDRPALSLVEVQQASNDAIYDRSN